MSTDRIEKKIVLRAPRSRVWRAIADAKEFGSWFGVVLESPFAAGARVRAGAPLPLGAPRALPLQRGRRALAAAGRDALSGALHPTR